MVGTEAPSVHRATEHICKLYQRFYTQTIYPKVIRNLYATPPSLFVPSAPPWHCVYLRPLRVSVCLLYKTLSLSLHVSEEPFITLLLCLLLSYYHVLNTLLPCLLLLCLMSSITLSHVFHYSVSCLPLLCYHVSYYPVSIKECKTTKKSWQVNYPKEPYPSKQLTCQLVYLFTRLLKKTRLLKISQPFIISSSWTQQA